MEFSTVNVVHCIIEEDLLVNCIFISFFNFIKILVYRLIFSADCRNRR